MARQEVRGARNELIGYLEESGDRINAISVRGNTLGYYHVRDNVTRDCRGTVIAKFNDTISLLRSSS